MQKKEDITIKKGEMMVPVILCLIFITCCFIYVTYVVQKCEKKNVASIYSAAKQNQLTLKNQMEKEFYTLKGLAVCLGAMDQDNKEQMDWIISGINEESHSMKVGYEFGSQWMESGRYDDYYKVPVRNKEDQTVGLLYAMNSVDMLSSMMDSATLAGEGFSGILDQHGSVVAGRTGFREQEKIQEVIQKGSQSPFTIMSQDNQRQTAVLIPLGINDWYILSVFPKDRMGTRHVETGIGTLILLSSGLFLYFFRRQWRIIHQKQKAFMESAYMDGLTGCRNFTSFKREAKHAIQENDISSYAVWYCDIKKFKYINDILGY